MLYSSEAKANSFNQTFSSFYNPNIFCELQTAKKNIFRHKSYIILSISEKIN